LYLVPFKDKDRINKAYHEAISAHYDKLRLDDSERREMQMKTRLDNIKNDPKAKKDEKFHLKRQIDKLQSNLRQYENNLGFFNPHQENPFKAEVEKKMKRDKAKISELRELLKRVNQV